MEAYLDNSATTRCMESARDVVVKTMMEDYGNPSSRHTKGVEAERYLREARETIAATMKVNEKEIFFTSGGTESNNWALIGGAMANRRAGNHVITTAIEHAAVIQPLLYLQEQGFEVTYLPVDEKGHISLEDLRRELRDTTILVSVMYVNNEMGAVQPLEEIGKIIKAYNPGILFHFKHVAIFHLILGHQFFFPFFRIQVHGAKLVNLKTPAVFSCGCHSGLRKIQDLSQKTAD